MKKILLLSITSLAMLMADFTLDRLGGELTPVSETTSPVTEPTTPSTTTEPVSTNGIIPNSVDQIWNDVQFNSVLHPALMSSAISQFWHGSNKSLADRPGWKEISTWIEIESATFGEDHCGKDADTSTNTLVEVGHIRGYALVNGTWKQIIEKKTHGGSTYPYSGDWERSQCDKQAVYDNYPGYKVEQSTLSPLGFRTFRPDHQYRWHGWGGTRYIPSNPNDVKAYLTIVYMRLILKDPNGIDDRDQSKFIAHVGADVWTGPSSYYGDIGLSSYKRITNDWVAFSMISGGITKEELAANPPPFSLVP